VFAHCRLDGVEVLETEPIQRIELVGKPAEAVGKTVREARVAEAAVAAGRSSSGVARLEDGNVERRVSLFREEG
jgi:hypothetical protein